MRENLRTRLAAIVEHSGDAIISMGLDGIIATWNAGAQKLYGYHAQEAEGKPIAIVIQPDRQEDFSALMDSVKSGKQVEHFESVQVGKDGCQVEVSVGLSPLKDDTGRVIGAAWIAHGIPVRKRAEAASARDGLRPPSMRDAVAITGQAEVPAPWFTLEHVEDVRIVTFSRPDFEDSLVVEEVGVAMSRLAESESGRSFVVDLGAVGRVGSVMLGKFVAFHRKVGNAGGQLAICSLPPAVAEKFRATNLDKIFRIYPGRQEALAALRK